MKINKIILITSLFLILLSCFVTAGLEDNIVLAYKFDGDLVNSKTGSSATNYGSTSTSSGKINQGRLFDGTNDFINSTASLSGSDFTLNMWVKRDDLNNEDGLVDSLDDAIFWKIKGDDRFEAYLNFGATLNSVGTITDTNWHMVTMSYDGSEVIFYIDGVNNTHIPLSLSLNSLSYTMIGTNRYNQYFDGTIDEFTLWDDVKTPSEILTLHNDLLQYPFTLSNFTIGATNLDEETLLNFSVNISNSTDFKTYFTSEIMESDKILNHNFTDSNITDWSTSDCDKEVNDFNGNNVFNISVVNPDTVYSYQTNIMDVDSNYKIELDYYLPSSNVNFNNFEIRAKYTSESVIDTEERITDSWQHILFYYVPNSTDFDNIYIYLLNSASASGLNAGDFILIDNVNITKLVTGNPIITTDILDTYGLYNINISAENYYMAEYLNFNVSSNLNAEMFQSIVNFTAENKISGENIINFTATSDYGANTNITPLLYFDAKNYNVTFSKSGYFSEIKEITTTPLTEQTENFIVFNHQLNISLNDLEASGNPNIFSINLTSDDYDYNEYISTTTGNILFNLTHGNYTLLLNGTGWSEQNYSIELPYADTYTNETLDSYTANALLINIYDGITELPVLYNVSVRLSSGGIDFTNYTSSGQLYLDELLATSYTVRINNINFSQSQYVVSIAENSFQVLNAYLYNYTPEVLFTTYNINTGDIIEGAYMTVQNYINGSLTTIATYESDITGRIKFNYDDTKYYNFIVTAEGYNQRVFSLDPITFSSYQVKLSPLIEITDSSDYSGVIIDYSPTEFYENQTNNIEFLFNAPLGNFVSFGYNVTYPDGFIENSSTNVYGGNLTSSFNIINATLDDKVTISYYYRIAEGELKTFTYTYSVILESGDYTFTSLKGKDFGLSDFEKIIAGNSLIILIAGAGSYFLNPIVGAVMGFIFMGIMGVMGFMPLWSILISLFVGFIIIGWRSSQ